jgi:hypothetical protein
MARTCTMIGGILVVLGLAVALGFLVAIQRDDAYAKAALASARNPGNVMYEAEFGAARVRRGFQLGGVVAGVLLGINGSTLFGLGIVAARRDQPDASDS